MNIHLEKHSRYDSTHNLNNGNNDDVIIPDRSDE